MKSALITVFLGLAALTAALDPPSDPPASPPVPAVKTVTATVGETTTTLGITATETATATVGAPGDSVKTTFSAVDGGSVGVLSSMLPTSAGVARHSTSFEVVGRPSIVTDGSADLGRRGPQVLSVFTPFEPMVTVSVLVPLDVVTTTTTHITLTSTVTVEAEATESVAVNAAAGSVLGSRVIAWAVAGLGMVVAAM